MELLGMKQQISFINILSNVYVLNVPRCFYPDSVGESQTETIPHKEFPNNYCLLYIHVRLVHYLLFGHSYHVGIYFFFLIYDVNVRLS